LMAATWKPGSSTHRQESIDLSICFFVGSGICAGHRQNGRLGLLQRSPLGSRYGSGQTQGWFRRPIDLDTFRTRGVSQGLK
jgi:hypothetical protein